MTTCRQVRILILNYMDSHGHHVMHAMEASALYGCSVRTIWKLIRRRKEGESISERYSLYDGSLHCIIPNKGTFFQQIHVSEVVEEKVGSVFQR